MVEISSEVAGNNSFIRSAWQIGSRHHSKIFHILNQILLFVEIADRIWKIL